MWVLVFTLSISLLFGTPCADKQPKPAKRRFEIKVEKDKLQIQAVYQNNTIEDKFQFEVKLGRTVC